MLCEGFSARCRRAGQEVIEYCVCCFSRVVKYAKSYFNLSALLINDNNITSSINCLKKALRIDPNNYDYNFALGILLEYSGSFTKAKKYFYKIFHKIN